MVSSNAENLAQDFYYGKDLRLSGNSGKNRTKQEMVCFIYFMRLLIILIYRQIKYQKLNERYIILMILGRKQNHRSNWTHEEVSKQLVTKPKSTKAYE